MFHGLVNNTCFEYKNTVTLTKIHCAMLPYSTTYYDTIYRNFKLIEAAPDAQHAIIRYFENNVEKIQYLETLESFELLVAYNEALFDVGAHQAHVKTSTQVLETSIQENIKKFGGQNIFEHTLYCKAQSHIKLYEVEAAIHIFQELIRIDANNTTYKNGLQNCYMSKQPDFLLYAKAVFIVFNLIVAAIIGVKLFVIEPFYPQYEQLTDIILVVSIVLGISIICFAKAIQYIDAHRKLTLYCKKIEALKNNKISNIETK